MTAPNVVDVQTITGKTTSSTPSNNTSNVLLANPASSGKVFKINTLIAANIDGTNPYDVSVALNSLADGSGSSSAIASTISVPADASLLVIDKSFSIYLEENRSIVVTSSVASKVTYTVSYEEIS
jgi:hypothetical protein